MSLLAPENVARRQDLAVLAVVIGVAGSFGYLGVRDVRIAVALAAVAAGLLAAAIKPIAAAVLTMPALWAIKDIGLGAGASTGDAVMIGAAMLAFPAVMHSDEVRSAFPIRRAFWGYLALLLPSMAAHYSNKASIELVHRVTLVLAPVIVGIWLARENYVAAAIRGFMIPSALFAVVCMLDAVKTGFDPAFPFGYHKNFAGSLLSTALLLLICVRQRLKIPSLLWWFLVVLIALGDAACQSRGALLGAALGLLIWFFLAGSASESGTSVGRRARAAGALFGIVIAVAAVVSVKQQFDDAATVHTSSVGVRQDVESYTLELWRSSPLVGVGIRYFNTGQYGFLATASNNAVDSELAESGVIGLAGFVLLHAVAAIAMLRRRRSDLGVAGLAVLSANLLHGMFDIYWSSGITPLSYLVVGLAFGAFPRPTGSRRDG